MTSSSFRFREFFSKESSDKTFEKAILHSPQKVPTSVLDSQSQYRRVYQAQMSKWLHGESDVFVCVKRPRFHPVVLEALRLLKQICRGRISPSRFRLSISFNVRDKDIKMHEPFQLNLVHTSRRSREDSSVVRW